eukprot:5975436-Amphidinium_carterae.1
MHTSSYKIKRPKVFIARKSGRMPVCPVHWSDGPSQASLHDTPLQLAAIETSMVMEESSTDDVGDRSGMEMSPEFTMPSSALRAEHVRKFTPKLTFYFRWFQTHPGTQPVNKQLNMFLTYLLPA